MHLRAAMGVSLGGLRALNNFITVLKQHCMRLRAAVLLQMALYVFAGCSVISCQYFLTESWNLVEKCVEHSIHCGEFW